MDALAYRRIVSETERRMMLADIARVALTIGRDLYSDAELSDLDIGGANETGQEPCPRERLAFLQAAWARFAPALRILEASPPMGLRPETRLVAAERARRVTSKDLLHAMRREGIFPPRRVAERFSAAHADTQENRLVKAALVRFARDLRDIADLAVVCAAPEVLTDALRLRHRFRVALRREPWRSATLIPNPTLPPTQLRNGAYRIFHDALRRHRQGFAFDWRSPLFHLPPRETWRIYEFWCLFQTADALRSLGFRAIAAEDFSLSRGGLTFTLATGNAARLTFAAADGRRIALAYRRAFSPSGEAWHSASHAMEPDISLESDGRLLLLDAKWKTYTENSSAPPEEESRNAPLTDDMNQMHAYRDGIRRGGKRAARGAWLLYPGKAGASNRAIIAYPEPTAEQPFGAGRTGAILLRPGIGGQTLARLIETILLNPGSAKRFPD